MFKKILIANRGEIAVRIMTTARKLGIKTVAVYSEADNNALHVRMADEAVFIGPSPSVQSYLKIDNIIKAIDQTGAQAVHPGYGFLSENAEFAKRIAREGVAFIGPSPEAIQKMGDKITAKKIAEKAGVNTIPGSKDIVSSEEEALTIARQIGYPVMIKATAGGGGKGMRVARNDDELKEGMHRASSEAQSSFSDNRVFIEKFFDNPRHIEIQVLGDKHGNIITLGERECSIQRRHQKVIEEAPSSFLTPEVRQAMSEQAVALAREVGYYSAGTVECIMDEHRNFYFLEMNTRLQVEHRVTELVTGIDLVEQMIRVANGEKLSLKQEEVQLDGWAFESRVYAEDPSRGFLPSSGRVTGYQEPDDSPHVLVDTGVYEGGKVSMFYDPMIAKVCTHAATRTAAIETMRAALSTYYIGGVSHNIGFLEAILSHPRFVAGDISTHFIEQEYPGGFEGTELTTETEGYFLATAMCIYLREAERKNLITGQMPGRQRALNTRWVVQLNDASYPVEVQPRNGGMDIAITTYELHEDEDWLNVRTSWQPGDQLFQAIMNGRQVSVRLSPLPDGYRLSYGGTSVDAVVRSTRVAELAKYMPPRRANREAKNLLAPFSGMVPSIKVQEGDVVKPGQVLLIIEAMKMENAVQAPAAVKIGKIHIAEGESVAADQLLIDFEKGE